MCLYVLSSLMILPGMHCQAASVSGPTASTDIYQVKRRTEATRPLESGVRFQNLARKRIETYNPPKRKVSKMPTLSLHANWILQIVGSGKSSITTSTMTLGTWRCQYLKLWICLWSLTSTPSPIVVLINAPASHKGGIPEMRQGLTLHKVGDAICN